MSQKYRPHKTFCSLSSCSAVDRSARLTRGVGEGRRAVVEGERTPATRRAPVSWDLARESVSLASPGCELTITLPWPEPAGPSSERPVMPRGAPMRVFGLSPRGPPVSDGSAVGLRAIGPVIVMLGDIHGRADVSSSGLLCSPHGIASPDTPVATRLPGSCLGFRRPRHASLVQSLPLFGPGRSRSPQLCGPQLCGFPSAVTSQGRRTTTHSLSIPLPPAPSVTLSSCLPPHPQPSR